MHIKSIEELIDLVLIIPRCYWLANNLDNYYKRS